MCASLFECDAILYPVDVGRGPFSPSGDGDGDTHTRRPLFTLKHLPLPQSQSLLPTSLLPYVHSGSYVPLSSKSRTYVVNSYGGCGSKMLAGWLTDLPAANVKTVKHMHDPNPPKDVKAFNRPLNEATRQPDYRSRHIPGGWYQHQTGGSPLPLDSYDSFRYIYLVKEPVEGLVSRYCYGHCLNVGGACGTSEAAFPSLAAYALSGVDSMGLGSFYEHWTSPPPPRRRGGGTPS